MSPLNYYSQRTNNTPVRVGLLHNILTILVIDINLLHKVRRTKKTIINTYCMIILTIHRLD